VLKVLRYFSAGIIWAKIEYHIM